MSPWIAQKMMQAAERFGEKRDFHVFNPSVIYALAAPSTPDTVVELAMENGSATTVADVKDWKAEAELATSLAQF